jgi:hypothetical protein
LNYIFKREHCSWIWSLGKLKISKNQQTVKNWPDPRIASSNTYRWLWIMNSPIKDFCFLTVNRIDTLIDETEPNRSDLFKGWRQEFLIEDFLAHLFQNWRDGLDGLFCFYGFLLILYFLDIKQVSLPLKLRIHILHIGWFDVVSILTFLKILMGLFVCRYGFYGQGASS